MAIVNTTFTFTSDTETVTRTKLNNLVADLLTDYNGNIDSSNLANNAVNTAEITNSAVTTDKINDNDKKHQHQTG